MAPIAPLTKYSMKKDVTLRCHTFKTSLSLGEGGGVIDFKIFWNGKNKNEKIRNEKITCNRKQAKEMK